MESANPRCIIFSPWKLFYPNSQSSIKCKGIRRWGKMSYLDLTSFKVPNMLRFWRCLCPLAITIYSNWNSSGPSPLRATRVSSFGHLDWVLKVCHSWYVCELVQPILLLQTTYTLLLKLHYFATSWIFGTRQSIVVFFPGKTTSCSQLSSVAYSSLYRVEPWKYKYKQHYMDWAGYK